jgi:hypothetical protein
MSINLSDNILAKTTAPLDAKYGPYVGATLEDAKNLAFSFLDPTYRYEGLSIGIKVGSNSIKDYWFLNGIENSDLVLKEGINELSNLTDVIISNPIDKQSLVYNESENKWVNENLGGFVFATVDNQLDVFAKTYLDELTPSRIITGSINEPLTYTGEFQLFEIVNVSRQLGLTLSSYGDINITSSININEDTDLAPGTYLSAPSGSYFSSITFGTSVGNQSIKIYERVKQPPLIEDGLFTTSSVIISKNLYIYENLEVFGKITGYLEGSSSYAETASYALNTDAQGSGFPFSGSAEITGSIVIGNTDFPIINNTVTYNQTSSLSSAIISIEPKSNLIDTSEIDPGFSLNDWNPSPSAVFNGTVFTLYIRESFSALNLDYLVNTRLFVTGSTDIFGVSGYKYLGDVISWGFNDGGTEDDSYYVNVRSVMVTSSLPSTTTYPNTPLLYKFFPSSGSGVVNLEGYVTASKGLFIPENGYRVIGNSTITGSLFVTGSINVIGAVSASNFIGSALGLTGIVTNPMFENLLVNANITATGSLNSQGANQLNLGTTNYTTKSINLGSIESLYGVDNDSERLDQNTINLSRNLSRIDTPIHTQINFNGRYWQYFPGPDLYDALPDLNNHYLRFMSPAKQTGDITSRVVNLEFSTRDIGSTIVKGFSTDYLGSVYFNITGSVSASAYFGDGSNLQNLYTSPVYFADYTSSHTASVSDIGDMVELSGSSTIFVVLPSTAEVAIPTGSQLVYIMTGTQITTFVTGSSVTIMSSGGKRNIFDQYSVVTAVKKTDYSWYLFGGLS